VTAIFRWDTQKHPCLRESWIIDYILSRNIQHLEIDCFDGFQDLAGFDRITSLRSFTVKNIFSSLSMTGKRVREVLQGSRKIIAQSPELNTLGISTACHVATEHSPTLHGFLPPSKERSPPLALKHLQVSCLRMLLDTRILFHLRHLQSLSIRNNLPTPELGSNLSTIWRTLKDENIHLTSVDLSLVDVEDGFLDYLLSNPAIRDVVLDNSARVWYSTSQANIIATRFFEEILPKISHLLRTLHIVSFSANKWCFGAHNAAAFGTCKNLRTLKVSISISGPKPWSVDTESKAMVIPLVDICFTNAEYTVA